MKKILVSLALLALAGIVAPPVSQARTLAFEERVEAQRAIEEVYWRHRIWPAENPDPKPAPDEVLSDAVIRERVASYLEQSAALDDDPFLIAECLARPVLVDRLARN